MGNMNTENLNISDISESIFEDRFNELDNIYKKYHLKDNI